RLAAFLPAEASVGEPVDMVGAARPQGYPPAGRGALPADHVDALIVIYTPVDPTCSSETLDAIRNGIATGRAAGAAKPILGCLMAGTSRPQPLIIRWGHRPRV